MMTKRPQKGAALVEAAIALPLLLLVLLGASDFGRLSYVSVLLANAASAGARFGSLTPTNATNAEGIQKAVIDDLGSTNVGHGLNITVERFCTCAPDDSSIACGNVCPIVGNYSVQPRVYVRVGVQSTFDTLFAYPGVPKSVLVARESRMRVE